MNKKQLNIWQDPAKEIGEALLDEALDDISPALAKVPLLSTAIAAVKSGKAWSDYLLARKVQQFYVAWEILSEPERKVIYEKFQKKPRNFIEKLLFIIDKQEDGEKCEVLGKLTISYLKGDIRRGVYLNLIETVTHLTMTDLKKLAELLQHQSLILPERKVRERNANTFISRGLMISAPRIPAEQRDGVSRAYKLTNLGETLARAVE